MPARLFALFPLGICAITSASATERAAAPEPVELSLVFSHDRHGALDPCG